MVQATPGPSACRRGPSLEPADPRKQFLSTLDATGAGDVCGPGDPPTTGDGGAERACPRHVQPRAPTVTAGGAPSGALGALGTSLGARLRAGTGRLTTGLGGPARLRAVSLLAAVLGVDAADRAAVGATAFELERSLHIGNAGIGLAVTVSALVGAVATLPVGALVDRTRRVTILWVSVLIWGVAQVATGLAPDFLFFVLARLALGGVTASAGPAVASLTGDLFPGAERGRIYAFILTGEVLGSGVGVLVAGLVAGWFGWRPAFFVLAAAGTALAWALHRFLPEPARGGQSRIEIGDERILPAEEVGEAGDRADSHDTGDGPTDSLVVEELERGGVRPDESEVLEGPIEDLDLWQAARYVLSVRTNLILIVASSLGYFFFAGLQTFALIYVREHYGIGQSAATLLVLVVGAGVIGGLLVAGHAGDRLIRRGRVDARIVIGVIGFLLAALLLVPAIVSRSLLVSAPLFVLAGIAVSAPNPGLDAARLDVVPSRMWGRAEAVRTVLRQTLQAFAPLLFGLTSLAFGGANSGFGSGVELSRGHAISNVQATSLEYTFLVMLVPVVAGGLILLRARRSYPVDVMSAAESDRRHRAEVTTAG